MTKREGRRTKTHPFRHSSFALRHWFPVSLSCRDGAVRRPGAQSWTPLRSARRRGRPSSRIVGGLLLLPKEGRVCARFPQTRHKPRRPPHWFVFKAAVSVERNSFRSARTMNGMNSVLRGLETVSHAARRRGFCSSASTTRSMAIIREPFTNTTSPGNVARRKCGNASSTLP